MTKASGRAYTLIHYGTNDWLHCGKQVPCYTVFTLVRLRCRAAVAALVRRRRRRSDRRLRCNFRSTRTYLQMVAARASTGDVPLPELLDQARRGDGDAFGEVYRRFSRRILGLCLHLLRGREDAEDATTEVFLRLRGALSSYDRSLPLNAWLTTVATNHCLDRLRRRRREARLFASEQEQGEAWPAESRSPLAEIVAEEERMAVAAAVAALPDRYRVPLALRYYGEMSYDDIAARLGQTRQDVATSLFRAKQRLRRALAPPSETP